MKKIKLNSEEFLRPVVTYMLREFGVDYDYVVKHQTFGKIPWFQYYWDSPETKKEFLDWLRLFLKTKVDYKPNSINDIVSQIDLMWGLKVYVDDVKK
jgi:hypothetical protein